MVVKGSAESARKSAPASDVVRVAVSDETLSESFLVRGARARLARQRGSNPAPRGVPPAVWKAERALVDLFDLACAADYVRLHDAFAFAFRTVYGRDYDRSLDADWAVLRLLVRELTVERALVAIDRAFREAWLVGAGIDSPALVLNRSSRLLEQENGDRSRLTPQERRLCARVMAERQRAGGAS